jgi:hypothetical protein
MDFEQITDKEKEALHIACVSESSLVFRKGNFGDTIEFDKYDDGEFSIELMDDNIFYFTKEQLAFIVKWISYSR